MSNHQEYTIESLANEIKTYLDQYPSSADSLDGITRWWLYKQRYLKSMEQVQHALNLLVSEGVLSKLTNTDGKVIYCLRGKADEKTDLLNK